jgi:hypothetical protein
VAQPQPWGLPLLSFSSSTVSDASSSTQVWEAVFRQVEARQVLLLEDHQDPLPLVAVEEDPEASNRVQIHLQVRILTAWRAIHRFR